MGYIIVDKEIFKEQASKWNNTNYCNSALSDLSAAEVNDYSALLEVLQLAEEKIDKDIEKLKARKKDIKSLMAYANGK